MMDTTGAGETGAESRGGTTSARRHDVFISCTPDDQEVAEAISARLRQRQLTSWYPLRDALPGDDERTQIDAAIKASRAVVLAFTDAANASAEVLREMSVAIDADVEIVPFKLTSTLPVMGLEYYLSTLPWVDGTTEPIDESARGLAVAVGELLGKPASANKLTELWQRAKDSDGSEDISDMGVPVTIVVPEQGSWETEPPTSGTQELAMATAGVPVTIVYPEAGTWEVSEGAGQAAEAGDGADGIGATDEGAGDGAEQAASASSATASDAAATVDVADKAEDEAPEDGDTVVTADVAGKAEDNATEDSDTVVTADVADKAEDEAPEANDAVTTADVADKAEDNATETSGVDNDGDAADSDEAAADNSASDGAAGHACENAMQEAPAEDAATEEANDPSESSGTHSPEEELLAVSLEAAKQLRQMTKKDEDGPAPFGDIAKVVIALLLAMGTLLYLLITSA